MNVGDEVKKEIKGSFYIFVLNNWGASLLM